VRTTPKVARSTWLDELPDLISFAPPDGVVWLREHEGFVGWGEAVRIDPGTGPRRFARAMEMLQEMFERIDHDASDVPPLRAVGSFTFDPARPGSYLVLPKVLVGSENGKAWVTTIDEDIPDLSPRFERSAARRDRVRYSGSSISEVAWLDFVARATEAIADERFAKVVLARDVQVWSEEPFDLPAIVGRLALRFPGCFTFMTDGLVGASPERLIERNDGRVRSTVLAGSAPRGKDNDEDDEIGRTLLDSTKDADEHDLAVRSVLEVLDPVCKTLRLDGPHLMRLANVQHLATDFIGELSESPSALELAGRLHPTAAVGGAPREPALRFIGEHEGLDRGRYTGPVGWVDPQGDGEWAIALRCAELEGKRGRLFAGNGIVADSLPEAELEETRLKLRAMESVLGDPGASR
jgi:menaquinone-specific isochorismate synthase